MIKKTMIFLLAGTAIFTACKKDAAVANLTTSQKVVGKWTLVSDVNVSYKSGVSSTNNHPVLSTNYGDFRTDGHLYSYDGSGTADLKAYDTSTYKIISDNFIIILKDTAQISTLTSNSFVFYYKEYYGNDSSILTISLKK